jgi:hypothetical protein
VSAAEPEHERTNARIAFVGGGEPTPEEIAAIVVALTPVATPDSGGARRGPAWLRASRLEGTGAPTVSSAADLATRAPWW